MFRPDPSDLRAFLRRLVLLCGLITGLLVAGAVAFRLTTDLTLWASFLLALDTIATVGAIPPPENTAAEIVRVILITLGVGTLFYALVTVTESFVAGHLGQLMAQRRERRMIESLSDHFIVCGFGRVGRQVAGDLRASGAACVVIDTDAAKRAPAEDLGVQFLEGDAGEDEVLRAAGIDRARGVLACVDSDAGNIFITLSARGLRDDVEIIARAAADESERKLRRAGADHVISPYKSSGTEMARHALHPQVTGVVYVSPDHRIDEIEVSPGCAGADRRVDDVRGGALLVGVRRVDGEFVAEPPGDLVLVPGDVIVAMGTVETMDRLETLFDPPGRRAAATA